MFSKKLKFIIFCLFFLSGAAGLIYELVWIRWATLLIGTTQQAVSLVIAIFFSGLAAGAYIGGILSKNTRRPLYLYGIVEVFAGIWMFISQWLWPLSFTIASDTLIYIYIFIVLFPATFSLGMTLPLLVKFFDNKSTALLYGFNTLGAVVGVLFGGILLPQVVGFNNTLRIAIGLSFFAGIISLIIQNISKHKKYTEKLINSKPIKSDIQQKILFSIVFISGFASISLEVLLTKLFVLTLGGSIYSVSIVLLVYLTGIGLGSLLFTKFYYKNPAWLFFLVHLGIGTLVVAILVLFDKTPLWILGLVRNFAKEIWLLYFAQAGLVASLILLPTLLMGIAFPLAVSMISGRESKGVSLVFSINTIGGILGSLAAGFVLIPIFGLQKSILFISLIYLTISIVILIKHNKRRKLWLGFVLAIVFVAIILPQWNKEQITSGVYANKNYWIENVQNSRLTFYKEGLYGTVSVRKFADGDKILQINGKNEASSDFDADAAQFLGHISMALGKDAKNALLVGLGGGFTLDALTDYDLKNIDFVEIEPVVVEAARSMADVNNGALSDQRVKEIIADGRKILQRQNKTYDLIISQPSNPWLTGVSNLFTKEYYDLGKKRLNENGLMLAWLQGYSMSATDVKIALATFRDVFPHVQVWTNFSGFDLVLVGSQSQIGQPEFSPNIKKLEIDNQGELQSLLLLNESQVDNFLKDVKLRHTDNFPVLEFSTPLRLYEETVSNNLQEILKIRGEQTDLWGQYRNDLLNFEKNKSVGKFDDGLEYLGQALKVDETNRQVVRLYADLVIDKARKFYENKEIEFALQQLDEAIKIYPEGFLAYRVKAEILLEQSRNGPAFHLATVKEAESLLINVLEIASYDSKTHVYLGIIAGIYGDYDNAQKYLLKAVELNPRDTFALNNLAKAYFDQKNIIEARKAWEDSLKINPDQVEIRKALQKYK